MPSFILGALSAVRENVATDSTCKNDRFSASDGRIQTPVLDLAQQPDSLETQPEPFLSLQLNSEYRSTYQWHEFKPSIRQDVVRRPPQSTVVHGRKVIHIYHLLYTKILSLSFNNLLLYCNIQLHAKPTWGESL